jgi:hypothetical protein
MSTRRLLVPENRGTFEARGPHLPGLRFLEPPTTTKGYSMFCSIQQPNARLYEAIP